jgi:hypothetical protein
MYYISFKIYKILIEGPKPSDFKIGAIELELVYVLISYIIIIEFLGGIVWLYSW